MHITLAFVGACGMFWTWWRDRFGWATAVLLVVAGIYAYDIGLVWSQWLGFALIVLVVTLLPIERRRVVAEVPADLVPAPAAG